MIICIVNPLQEQITRDLITGLHLGGSCIRSGKGWTYNGRVCWESLIIKNTANVSQYQYQPLYEPTMRIQFRRLAPDVQPTIGI
jgi:hypothetical protein